MVAVVTGRLPSVGDCRRLTTSVRRPTVASLDDVIRSCRRRRSRLMRHVIIRRDVVVDWRHRWRHVVHLRLYLVSSDDVIAPGSRRGHVTGGVRMDEVRRQDRDRRRRDGIGRR